MDDRVERVADWNEQSVCNETRMFYNGTNSFLKLFNVNIV